MYVCYENVTHPTKILEVDFEYRKFMNTVFMMTPRTQAWVVTISYFLIRL
jgi:hypothetical protein